MAAVIALLIAVVIGLAYDKRIAAVFVVSAVAVFVVLRGIAAADDGAGEANAAQRVSRCCGWRSPISIGPAR